MSSDELDIRESSPLRCVSLHFLQRFLTFYPSLLLDGCYNCIEFLRVIFYCSFSSTVPVGGVDGQSRLSQEASLLFPTYPNASTPPPESNAVEVTNALKVLSLSTPDL
jgi:hypothetical protein